MKAMTSRSSTGSSASSGSAAAVSSSVQRSRHIPVRIETRRSVSSSSKDEPTTPGGTPRARPSTVRIQMSEFSRDSPTGDAERRLSTTSNGSGGRPSYATPTASSATKQRQSPTVRKTSTGSTGSPATQRARQSPGTGKIPTPPESAGSSRRGSASSTSGGIPPPQFAAPTIPRVAKREPKDYDNIRVAQRLMSESPVYAEIKLQSKENSPEVTATVTLSRTASRDSGNPNLAEAESSKISAEPETAPPAAEPSNPKSASRLEPKSEAADSEDEISEPQHRTPLKSDSPIVLKRSPIGSQSPQQSQRLITKSESPVAKRRAPFRPGGSVDGQRNFRIDAVESSESEMSKSPLKSPQPQIVEAEVHSEIQTEEKSESKAAELQPIEEPETAILSDAEEPEVEKIEAEVAAVAEDPKIEADATEKPKADSPAADPAAASNTPSPNPPAEDSATQPANSPDQPADDPIADIQRPRILDPSPPSHDDHEATPEVTVDVLECRTEDGQISTKILLDESQSKALAAKDVEVEVKRHFRTEVSPPTDSEAVMRRTVSPERRRQVAMAALDATSSPEPPKSAECPVLDVGAAKSAAEAETDETEPPEVFVRETVTTVERNGPSMRTRWTPPGEQSVEKPTNTADDNSKATASFREPEKSGAEATKASEAPADEKAAPKAEAANSPQPDAKPSDAAAGREGSASTKAETDSTGTVVRVAADSEPIQPIVFKEGSVDAAKFRDVAIRVESSPAAAEVSVDLSEHKPPAGDATEIRMYREQYSEAPVLPYPGVVIPLKGEAGGKRADAEAKAGEPAEAANSEPNPTEAKPKSPKAAEASKPADSKPESPKSPKSPKPTDQKPPQSPKPTRRVLTSPPAGPPDSPDDEFGSAAPPRALLIQNQQSPTAQRRPLSVDTRPRPVITPIKGSPKSQASPNSQPSPNIQSPRILDDPEFDERIAQLKKEPIRLNISTSRIAPPTSADAPGASPQAVYPSPLELNGLYKPHPLEVATHSERWAAVEVSPLPLESEGAAAEQKKTVEATGEAGLAAASAPKAAEEPTTTQKAAEKPASSQKPTEVEQPAERWVIASTSQSDGPERPQKSKEEKTGKSEIPAEQIAAAAAKPEAQEAAETQADPSKSAQPAADAIKSAPIAQKEASPTKVTISIVERPQPPPTTNTTTNSSFSTTTIAAAAAHTDVAGATITTSNPLVQNVAATAQSPKSKRRNVPLVSTQTTTIGTTTLIVQNDFPTIGSDMQPSPDSGRCGSRLSAGTGVRSENDYSPRTLTRIQNLNVIMETYGAEKVPLPSSGGMSAETRDSTQPSPSTSSAASSPTSTASSSSRLHQWTEVQADAHRLERVAAEGLLNVGKLVLPKYGGEVITHHPIFMRDTSKYWYKPTISREEAITMLKDKEPGTFVVRDSNSFPGAFGLALKVSQPPAGVAAADGTELVRHFLIEPSAKGVKLKGCSNEPVFGTLAALIYQHSITQLALPTKLILPDYDPASTPEHLNANQALLERGAACNVTYICTLDTESLTGPEAVRRAVNFGLQSLQQRQLRAVPVHFKVSSQGITLTDNTRSTFFRRHYPVNTVTFAGIDPESRVFDNNNAFQLPVTYVRQAPMFGFVARKSPSSLENACHVFAELDPEQPASAVVRFITNVMMVQARAQQQQIQRATSGV